MQNYRMRIDECGNLLMHSINCDLSSCQFSVVSVSLCEFVVHFCLLRRMAADSLRTSCSISCWSRPLLAASSRTSRRRARISLVRSRLALAAGAVGDGEAGAADRFEHAVVLQLAIGAGDGVRIDRQLAGQLADAGDQLAGGEGAVGDGEFHLADDLVVDRKSVMGVDLQEHGDRSPAGVGWKSDHG